ncbi:bile acid:sodium symporter family protein [Mucilaginibacter auburnensis]|uniref:BASS family bile acid:Na+ symporter n=1 Tax=Mucilaginibacter auburnensis TaxID=1457233 RepID=A0A2H9VQ29_9SPHI|nr:bile acid:sodium symporter family protein [Mucilaginibacter auburnensis]PJJ80422.1 BASS family bile acid:Na+ symporter [Mucilaginibacter auburnensis]
MKNTSLYKAALGAAVIALIAGVVMAFSGNGAQAGPAFIAFFLLLAVGVKINATTGRFSYTVLIFASTVAALYYPAFFTSWGDFKLSVLLIPLIQIIMFGMGTSMGINDFVGVVKNPRGVLIGVVSHFIIMPGVGYILASISGLPVEIAAGIVLIGCSPNGMASNVISYLAKANLALSITITAVSTLLSPFVTPMLMGWLAGAMVKIEVTHMMWEIVKMVILPIGAGLLFNTLFKKQQKIIDVIMPVISMAGIVIIITIIVAAGNKNLLTIGPLLLLLVLIHNLCGYTFGYWSGKLFKMNERDCRTMAIEVGMQNGGLATGIAQSMGKMATVGLAPAIFSPLMNITGSILASYWHGKKLDEASIEAAKTDTVTKH